MIEPILVFSIKPQWADAIRLGHKTVELRRRPPRLARPVTGYVYETAPARRVRLRCRFGPIVSAPPDALWPLVEAGAGATREAFDAYFAGVETAHGVAITAIEERPPLTLAALRAAGFSPPQAWCWAPPRVAALLEGGADGAHEPA